PVGAFRIGILTIAEKWSRYSNLATGFLTQPYLQTKFPIPEEGYLVYVNGAVCPTKELFDQVKDLGRGQVLYCGNILIAARPETEPIHEVQQLYTHSS